MKKVCVFVFAITIFLHSSTQAMQTVTNIFSSGYNLLTNGAVKELGKYFIGHPCPGPWFKETVQNYLYSEHNFDQVRSYFYHYTDWETFESECFDLIKEVAEDGYVIGMYHYIRCIGLRLGSTDQIMLCLKYVLISYILSQVDYQVCNTLHDYNKLNGAGMFNVLMDKYFTFLSKHDLIKKFDDRKQKELSPQIILRKMVIPWFSKFLPSLLENLKTIKEEKTEKFLFSEFDENILVDDLDEQKTLPPVCWIRIMKHDKGSTGYGNSIFFGILENDDINFCENKKESISTLREDLILKSIKELTVKKTWKDIFAQQVVSQKK